MVHAAFLWVDRALIGTGASKDRLTGLVLMELVASLRGRPCLAFALCRVCVDAARRTLWVGRVSFARRWDRRYMLLIVG